MTIQDQAPEPQPPPEKLQPKRIAIRPITIILFLVVNLMVLVVLGWPYLKTRYGLTYDLPLDLSSRLQASSIPQATQTIAWTPTQTEETATPTEVVDRLAAIPVVTGDPGFWSKGLMVLSMQEGLGTHLFAYQPLGEIGGPWLPLSRLTHGPWDDITPALSPDQEHLIFASNRDGQWDLYLLDFRTGETTRLTETAAYEAAPSWSPDGLWMAFEGYSQESLDIFIRPVDGSQEPVQLTNFLSADYGPAWSPQGRQIAFVSTQDGLNQIWLANLDESGVDRFVKVSQHYEQHADHPVWSPDGRYLAWAAVTQEGLHNIYVWDSAEAAGRPREVGSGDWAAWSPDGRALLVVARTPDRSYLTAYPLDQAGVVILPPLLLPGAVSGLLWADVTVGSDLFNQVVPTPTPLWTVEVEGGLDAVGGRWNLVPLKDVEAPYPQLHDRVDESFQAFRTHLALEVGWDLLASLENAYIPLSSALSPGLVEDWLYTGRAIAFNTLPINAGWMAVVREDFGQQTYWRVYLRARFQDGSQGRPLYDLPWDFNARYNGQPLPYDQGGQTASAVPGGYWIDMTQLATAYEWERLPAISTWRAVYALSRFNKLVKSDGLDWVGAMMEIYPPEVLLTLTPAPTATASQTPAPFWYQSPTPSTTITLTPTPTRTPSVTVTVSTTPDTAVSGTPSATSTVGATPSPSLTLTKTPTP
jgi:TolB protein